QPRLADHARQLDAAAVGRRHAAHDPRNTACELRIHRDLLGDLLAAPCGGPWRTCNVGAAGENDKGATGSSISSRRGDRRRGQAAISAQTRSLFALSEVSQPCQAGVMSDATLRVPPPGAAVVGALLPVPSPAVHLSGGSPRRKRT